MRLTSTAFAPGGLLPGACTCDGDDRSPDLAWTDVPENTRSLALVCRDADAPATGVLWVLFNLPADAIELSPGVPRVPELPSGARHGVNDAGDLGYRGPCPPPGAPHRYVFHLYALDSLLNVPAGATGLDLDRAMAGHVLAEAALTGIYAR